MEKRRDIIVGLVIQAAFLTLMASAAAAQERERVRVVVEKFMGSKANRVRSYAVSALSRRKEVELVATKDVVAALTRLGVTLDSEQGYMALSRDLEVNAFVDGEVTRNEKGWTASLWVRQGNGKFIGQYEWEHKKLGRLAVIKKTFWENLGDAILGAQVGEPESEPQSQSIAQEMGEQEPADEVTTPDTDGEMRDAPSALEDSKQYPTALIARLSLGANWRNNSFEPDEAEQPFHYFNEFLSPSPWLAICAKWFPAAHFSDEWIAHLGLAADFGIGMGASSVYEDPESDESVEPSTTSFAFSVGLLGRIPLDPVQLGLTVAYGQRVFETSGFEGLPDVAHSFLRLGASSDISIVGGLGVDLAIAYLLRLDSGEIASEDYFPEVSGGGVEGGIGVYYKVVDWLAIRADWSVQYFYFDTGTSDAFEDVTGGDDAFYTAAIGVSYGLGGDPR